MRILATDQSTNITGLAVLEDGKPVYHTRIDFSKEKNVPERIKKMFLAISKEIRSAQPDELIIEAVQQQANPKATMMLSQLQGMLIGYGYSENIPVSSPMPVEWRKRLGFHQGPSVKREELKRQAIDFVKEHFGIEASEDECEAICIAYSKEIECI